MSVLGWQGWLKPSDLGLATGALFASCTGPVTSLDVDVGGRTSRFQLAGWQAGAKSPRGTKSRTHI